MTYEIQKCHPERGKAESNGSIKDQHRRRRFPNWLARTYWCRSFKPQYAKHAILFMQNEPNFKNTKTNINHYAKSIYKQKTLTAQQKNEPKRTQFKTHRATIHLFMQNKANFKNAKMNINYYTTNNYNENRLRQGRKNKPKTNPNKPKQTQFSLLLRANSCNLLLNLFPVPIFQKMHIITAQKIGQLTGQNND